MEVNLVSWKQWNVLNQVKHILWPQMQTLLWKHVNSRFTHTAKIEKKQCFHLVPRAFSSFKMAVRETPWPELLTHDEMPFSEVVSSVWQPCLFSCLFSVLLFKQNEDISSCLRDEILTNFWSPLAALARGFSDRHFERAEGPGDGVDTWVPNSLQTRRRGGDKVYSQPAQSHYLILAPS